MKITFKMENEGKTIVLETNSVSLSNLFEDFQDFLAGAGFQVQGKSLDLIDDSFEIDTGERFSG